MELTKQDIQNILALISKTNIVGGEAIIVANLQQKLAKMVEDLPEVKEDGK